jgi:hypothetical protein
MPTQSVNCQTARTSLPPAVLSLIVILQNMLLQRKIPATTLLRHKQQRTAPILRFQSQNVQNQNTQKRLLNAKNLSYEKKKKIRKRLTSFACQIHGAVLISGTAVQASKG